MKIRAGTIKRIHIDRHAIAFNRKYAVPGKPDWKPVITIQTSKGSIKARVVTFGAGRMVQGLKPLGCGARIWIETQSEVIYE